jgi:hypothetical protein
MKDIRILLLSNSTGTKRKAGRPRLEWEEVIRKDLKEIETYWKGVKGEDQSRLG